MSAAGDERKLRVALNRMADAAKRAIRHSRRGQPWRAEEECAKALRIYEEAMGPPPSFLATVTASAILAGATLKRIEALETE